MNYSCLLVSTIDSELWIAQSCALLHSHGCEPCHASVYSLNLATDDHLDEHYEDDDGGDIIIDAD